MNAFFRRDYIYKFKTGAFKGINLRYLKYDRTSKEYIFIEGAYKQQGELALRVNKAYYIENRIERMGHIGYENTNQYLNKPKMVSTGFKEVI
jgi:hypothetical protein